MSRDPPKGDLVTVDTRAQDLRDERRGKKNCARDLVLRVTAKRTRRKREKINRKEERSRGKDKARPPRSAERRARLPPPSTIGGA